MTVLTDARPHSTAIRTAIDAAMVGGDWKAYDLDDVPKPLPHIYVVVHIERRYNPSLRLSAQASFAGWRVSLRCVGRTVDEVRWVMNRVATALNEKVLTVSGEPTTPIQFENDESPELDDGRYSALARYTYAR